MPSHYLNQGILLIGPIAKISSEILIAIHTFSFKKMYLKMSSSKWQLFCPGKYELTCIMLCPWHSSTYQPCLHDLTWLYCELHTNNVPSIIHRTPIDMRLFQGLQGTDIAKPHYAGLNKPFKSILLSLAIHYNMSGTKLEHVPDFELTTDTSYLALTGKLWVVCCEYLGENSP